MAAHLLEGVHTKSLCVGWAVFAQRDTNDYTLQTQPA